jgi:WD40-like Beta Propeller Repeat
MPCYAAPGALAPHPTHRGATHPFRLGSMAGALGLLALLSVPAQGQRAPDIYVASLQLAGGRVSVGAPRNVTSREGYDNQPAFARDGQSLLYTSTRDDAQADIYRVVFATGGTTRVTHTAPESEYSAAELPDGAALAVIRVERDSTQRLWRLPLAGGSEAPIFPALRPVGYHAWADAHMVAMFVLGTPNALVLGDTRTGRLDTLMMNIGRSMHRMPGTRQLSFVSKSYADAWYVMALDVDTRGIRPVARLPRGVEDYAWLPDGRLIAGSGSTLLVADPRGDAAWVAVADLQPAGISEITRLAVSPAGDALAIVAVPTR